MTCDILYVVTPTAAACFKGGSWSGDEWTNRNFRKQRVLRWPGRLQAAAVDELLTAARDVRMTGEERAAAVELTELFQVGYVCIM